MLTFLTLTLVVLGLSAGPLHLSALKNRNRWLSLALFGSLALLGFGLAYYIFFSTGTFFVAAITCLLIPVALIAAIITIWLRSRQWETLQNNASLRRMFYLGAVLIPILLAAPFFELIAFRSLCFSLNQRSAQPLIAAVERYHTQEGAYPPSLSYLLPGYLDAIPRGKCTPLNESSFEAPAFDLYVCSPEESTILTVPIGSGEWIQRYNFESGKWATISFLDGACSYLE